MQTSQGRQIRNLNRNYRSELQFTGTAAPKLDVVRELEQPLRRESVEVRRKRDRRKHMNLPYVVFLTFAMIATGAMLIGYLKMQSEMTLAVENIANLESELNNIRLTNDEQLQRINSAISMDEIKRIAVEELGMTYAKEGQVVAISSEGSDYVRQMESLPN